MNLRRWIALHLIFLADRLAPEDAFRQTGMSFEFVYGAGIEWNWDGHGCPLWYSGQADHLRAWERQRRVDDGLTGNPGPRR